MFFKLPKYIALRSWSNVQYAYYIKDYSYAKPLTLKQAQVMLLCDGEHDIEIDDTVINLSLRNLIVSCEKGDHPSEWSSYKKYDNLYFPKMNLMITGKCNYNCLHCFNAADNAPLMTEWKFEELCDLFDQAKDCGIHDFTITGGEPMVHKHFMDIVHEIYNRGMQIGELNTNGYFITQEILDEMKSIGCFPLIKISFDGIGCHDWMRDHKGAEKKTLDAMALCIKNGFAVKSQTQVHRKNVETMLPTAKLLNDMGVSEMRIIRTTEVPRWTENAGDACLTIEEYFEKMLDFAKEYQKSGMEMVIDIWQYLRLFPKQKEFYISSVAYPKDTYKPTFSGCRGNRGMIAISSSGEVVPCMQMSGYLMQMGKSFANVHKDKLKDVITSSPYLDNVCTCIGTIREKNLKCGSCKWFEACAGGCRALGLLYSGNAHDFNGSDIMKCYFFENGWYDRVCDTLDSWENKSRI